MNRSLALDVQALAWGQKAWGTHCFEITCQEEKKGCGVSLSCSTSMLTSFCSSRGRASVSRVIQKEQGAIWAVINISSSLAASENRFSPYSRWNSRYFPTCGCWWRVKGVSVRQNSTSWDFWVLGSQFALTKPWLELPPNRNESPKQQSLGKWESCAWRKVKTQAGWKGSQKPASVLGKIHCLNQPCYLTDTAWHWVFAGWVTA